jgi:hypothetical protein
MGLGQWRKRPAPGRRGGEAWARNGWRMALALRRSSPHFGAYWMSRQLPCLKSCPHCVADSVLPAGKCPHRIDAIHGSRRGTLAGVHRGPSPGANSVAVEAGRSAGSSPPFRLRGRIASHCPRAGGLALPGRRPPPVPPRRSRAPPPGRGHQPASGTRLHPRASVDRVGHSGRRTGSCDGRGLVPAVAAEREPGPDAAPPRSGAGLHSLQCTARRSRGRPGPEAGPAMSRLQGDSSPPPPDGTTGLAAHTRPD